MALIPLLEYVNIQSERKHFVKETLLRTYSSKDHHVQEIFNKQTRNSNNRESIQPL